MAKRIPRPKHVVTIRAHRGRRIIEAGVSDDAPLRRLAEEWAYVLRSRRRWADDPNTRLTLQRRALDDLERAGVPPAFVRKLASVHHVEVELHPWDAADAEAAGIHEAASDVPWEYLISAGTKAAGRYDSLVVTRLFRNGSPAVVPAPPAHVLFVESAPGWLADFYDFGSERARIRAAIGADVDAGSSDGAKPARVMTRSETETVAELKRTVRATPCDAVHVTGVDNHQVARFADRFYEGLLESRAIGRKIVDRDGRIRDGMILRKAAVAEWPVSFDELAETLVNPRRPPRLVALNLYYSGARTAREIVSRGAHAALGFLDEIDDELAEGFFQAFYLAWCRPGGAVAIPDAFLEAWQATAGPGDRLHGTAIVLWTGRSAVETVLPMPRAGRQPEPPAEDRQAAAERLARVPIGRLLQVELDVDPEINYSLLHNDRPLFNTLTLTKLVKEPLEDVTVHVELNLGDHAYAYRHTEVLLKDARLALAPLVRIPLTAVLPRSLRERVRSTVYVKVTCGGRTAWETTDRVTLIPVDEWLDDTSNNPWLPSFVLPRDPAILKILTASRRYLVATRDDPSAGFDGYQAVDKQAEEPSAGVDAQVRAIWTALVNDFRLHYINPPPSYSAQTQRLRTPSDVLASGTGTCIDLSLLLASCLEYIGIAPVLVLLTGHAFVGYWRSQDAHDEFVEMRQIPAEVPPVGGAIARAATVPLVDPYGWRLTRMHYGEIMTCIAAGDLVMLEATLLTSASAFSEAIAEGRANMRSKRELDSLLDIGLARSATPPVTPLPIISD